MRDPTATTSTGARRRLGLVVLLGTLLILAASIWKRQRDHAARVPADLSSLLTPEVLGQFEALEKADHDVDATVWAPEILAQNYAASVERLWEDLNRSQDPLERLQSVPIATLTAPARVNSSDWPQSIRTWSGEVGADSPAGPVADWQAQLAAWRAAGWRLDQTEWRHVEFLPSPTGTPPASRFAVRLNFSRAAPPGRAQANGLLRVHWPATPPNPPAPFFGAIDIERLNIAIREGPPLFRMAAMAEIQPFEKTTWIDPILLRRPSPGAKPEIILAARNLLLRPSADGSWSDATLSPHHPGLIFTAALADFDGDGLDDLLMAVRSGLVLLRGGPSGNFDSPPARVWVAPERLQYVQALTAGDIDHDGDLDVFLGQYRVPYDGGQMPHPYFDALDGPPAFLLQNQGNGQFVDVTSGSGLEPKRHRRTYGASFVDVDHDHHLDLVVVSDFAGMDVHGNNGKGQFADRTQTWIDEPRGFGMAHAYADFDADGQTDLLMAAMPQPTADRLAALGLERPGFESWTEQRKKMAAGNRLYFGGNGGFRERPVSATLSHAGWAWSTAILDFNNDRYPEAYFVNGHETRGSVRDYETEFWTHDIYTGNSTPDPAVNAYFASKFARTRAAGWSYGGHGLNAFFLNQAGTNFVEIGHLLGVALPEDSRNAVAVDWDDDGDLDLVVTTFEVWPRLRQTLRLFENTLTPTAHWVGVRLKTGPGTIPAVGAEVTVNDAAGAQRRPWTLGDGYRSQSLPELHFGLGTQGTIQSIEVRWPDGRLSRMENRAADAVYEFVAPNR
ncbi:MAG: CRTAC1 family protein [Verrucomicrobiales bacterium]|nr:CRTAC1 family protein [Verrucomicrobiales bacterium]